MASKGRPPPIRLNVRGHDGESTPVVVVFKKRRAREVIWILISPAVPNLPIAVLVGYPGLTSGEKFVEIANGIEEAFADRLIRSGASRLTIYSH